MRTQWIVGLSMALLTLAAAAVRAQVADLSLTASAQELTYTLTVSNAGQAMATGVVVTNQIPANVSVTSVSVGQVVIQSGLLTINLGSVPAGQSLTFNVTAQTTGPSGSPANSVNPVDLVRNYLTNTFIVSAKETAPNLANNSSTAISEMDSVFPGSPNSDYDVETLYFTSSNRINLSFKYPPNDSVTAYNQLGVFLQPYIPASGIIHCSFFAFHKIPSAKYAGEEESIRQLGARPEQLSHGWPWQKRTCNAQGQI